MDLDSLPEPEPGTDAVGAAGETIRRHSVLRMIYLLDLISDTPR